MKTERLGKLSRPDRGRRDGWPAGVVLLTLALAGSFLRAQAPSGGSERPQWMDAAPTSTGIAVGQKIPSFRAPDQNGRLQDFNSIRGPKGAVIFFNRSADW